MVTQSAPSVFRRPILRPIRLRPALLRASALGLVAGLVACGGGASDQRAAVEIRGTDPGASASASASAGTPTQPTQQTAPAAAAASSGGVIDYGSYQTVVAGDGDTVADLAARVGLSASQLGAYNGLTPQHSLRAGDELVLPPRPEGYASEAAMAAPGAALTAPAASTGGIPADSAIQTTPLPADSAPSSASGEQWSPALAAAAIERSTGLNPDGTLAAPPSSTEPVPPEPPARRELASPDLGRYQTGSTGTNMPPPAATTDVATAAGIEEIAASAANIRLVRPVEGQVAVGFNKSSGADRSDGVDFATTAGAPVVAAADGEVALVSESLGGLGTIVLLRHGNDLLTVYGRIDDVTVQKGDAVTAGQPIGVVSNAAPPAEPRMHFEVRRGAESLDPMQFL